MMCLSSEQDRCASIRAVEHTSRRVFTSAPLTPSISRGASSSREDVSLQARYASLGGDATGVIEDGDLLCAEAHHTLDQGLWALDPLVLSARSCALNPSPPSRER